MLVSARACDCLVVVFVCMDTSADVFQVDEAAAWWEGDGVFSVAQIKDIVDRTMTDFQLLLVMEEGEQ